MFRLAPSTTGTRKAQGLRVIRCTRRAITEGATWSGGWGSKGYSGYLPERLRWDLQAKCVHDGGGLTVAISLGYHALIGLWKISRSDPPLSAACAAYATPPLPAP